jgi:hypothetical protein
MLFELSRFTASRSMPARREDLLSAGLRRGVKVDLARPRASTTCRSRFSTQPLKASTTVGRGDHRSRDQHRLSVAKREVRRSRRWMTNFSCGSWSCNNAAAESASGRDQDLRRTWHRRLDDPTGKIFANECVVGEIGVGRIEAIDLGSLAGTQDLIRLRQCPVRIRP